MEGYDSTMGAARMIDVLSPRDAGLVSLLKSLGATKNPRDLTR